MSFPEIYGQPMDSLFLWTRDGLCKDINDSDPMNNFFSALWMLTVIVRYCHIDVEFNHVCILCNVFENSLFWQISRVVTCCVKCYKMEICVLLNNIDIYIQALKLKLTQQSVWLLKVTG